MLKGYAGDKIKVKLTITSLEEQPLKITDITSTIKDKIKYKLKTIEKGKVYNLEIKTSSGIKESFQGKIVLKTNSQKKPELEIAVIGTLEKEITAAPEYLYFGIIDASKDTIDPNSLERTITVSRVREHGLTIEKVEPSANWITAETETNKKGEKFTLIVKLDKDKLQKGQFREQVKIYTHYDKISEVVTIMLEGKVI